MASPRSLESSDSDDFAVTLEHSRPRKQRKLAPHATAFQRPSSRPKTLGVSTRPSGRPSFSIGLARRPLTPTAKSSVNIVVPRDGLAQSNAETTSQPRPAPAAGFYCHQSARIQSTLRKPFRSPFLKKPLEGSEPSAASTGDDGVPMRAMPRTLGIRRRVNVRNRPLHDPDADGALVLYEPPPISETDKLHLTTAVRHAPLRLAMNGQPSPTKAAALPSNQRPKVHVVMDPLLTKALRPHQVEGVKFLYDCVTGAKVDNAFGCIMADEMGLGKTLQCIALLWTLLRQSPDPGKPWIDKCIVVCPSSLVKNWANELVKWLGSIRINPYACDNKSGSREKVTRDLRHFVTSRGRLNMQPVLIISYETLRTHIDILKSGPIGLLLCDEGHRLKNSTSQTFQALNQLQVQRRVILSGTPIQNDLTEYFSLLNFANPGLLGSTAEFRRNYELPILRGRDSCATDKERQLSDQKLADLLLLASKFIIRRTNDLLSKYLPTKYEHVVFCQLVPSQQQLYEMFTQSNSVKRLISESNGSQSLRSINILKKLCNHPGLLNMPGDIPGSDDLWAQQVAQATSQAKTSGGVPGGPKGRAAAMALSSSGAAHWYPALSGKMLLLDRMLRQLRETTQDKVVLISNYTQTLDVFEQLCRSNRYGYARLDGSMTTSKRQQLVDRFNNPHGTEFVFLLSSKAGGCGINLIGANRLILFDPDWNPAADQQALARVWRDGQRKTCFIYRFVGTGTIEEKIFQRQSHKQSLSSCVVDEERDVERHFSRDQLRQLFLYDPDTRSDTHRTFRCRRCIKDRQFAAAPEPMAYGDTSTWNHFSKLELHKVHDGILKKAAGDVVSYVFQYKSHDTKDRA